MPPNSSRVVPVVMTCHKIKGGSESERLAQLLINISGDLNRSSIVRQEFYSVQEHSSPPNNSAGTDRFIHPWLTISNFDLDSYSEIRSCKQVHSVRAHIDGHAIDPQLTCTDPNGNGDPLTW